MRVLIELVVFLGVLTFWWITVTNYLKSKKPNQPKSKKTRK